MLRCPIFIVTTYPKIFPINAYLWAFLRTLVFTESFYIICNFSFNLLLLFPPPPQAVAISLLFSNFFPVLNFTDSFYMVEVHLIYLPRSQPIPRFHWPIFIPSNKVVNSREYSALCLYASFWNLNHKLESYVNLVLLPPFEAIPPSAFQSWFFVTKSTMVVGTKIFETEKTKAQCTLEFWKN
jgi:hypothetical protein